MMDPKLAEILMRAKAVDKAITQKSGGGQRAPQQRQVEQQQPSRSMYDEMDEMGGDDIQYLSEDQLPQHAVPNHTPSGGGGGLFDQMGVQSGPSGGGGNTPSAVDRMDVNSASYESSVNNSKLPEAIMKAMLESPIPMGDGGGTGVSEDFIKKINPGNSPKARNEVPSLPEPTYNESDESEYYNHPIREEQVRPREIPRTQPNVNEKVNAKDLRSMIAQEITKALPTIIEHYFDKRLIKENVQFQAGETTFSGTVAPLPKKKRIKRK